MASQEFHQHLTGAVIGTGAGRDVDKARKRNPADALKTARKTR